MEKEPRYKTRMRHLQEISQEREDAIGLPIRPHVEGEPVEYSPHRRVYVRLTQRQADTLGVLAEIMDKSEGSPLDLRGKTIYEAQGYITRRRKLRELQARAHKDFVHRVAEEGYRTELWLEEKPSTPTKGLVKAARLGVFGAIVWYTGMEFAQAVQYASHLTGDFGHILQEFSRLDPTKVNVGDFTPHIQFSMDGFTPKLHVDPPHPIAALQGMLDDHQRRVDAAAEIFNSDAHNAIDDSIHGFEGVAAAVIDWKAANPNPFSRITRRADTIPVVGRGVLLLGRVLHKPVDAIDHLREIKDRKKTQEKIASDY